MRLFLFFTTILYSGFSFSSSQLFCSIKGRKSELRVIETEAKVVDFDFSSTSFIPSFYNCLSFLDSLPVNHHLQFAQLVTASSAPKSSIRLTSESKSVLHNLCTQTVNCKINFPYNLTSLSGLKSLLGSSKNASRYCETGTTQEAKLDTPAKIQLVSEKLLQWWEQPKSNLSLELLDVIIKESPKQIVISTMTLSRNELAVMNEYLNDNSAAQVFVFYAFGLATFDSEYPLWLDDLNPRLFLIPVFTTVNSPSSFHLKGISWDSGIKNGLIFNSSNFKTYDNKNLYDIGFRTQDKDLSEDFTSQLFYLGRSLCERSKVFDCHLNQRYHHSSTSQNILRNRFSQACRYLPAPSFSGVSKMQRGPLKANILSFIAQAKSSITIYVHALNDRDVINLIEEKQKMGVKIQIFLGQEEQRKKIDYKNLSSSIKSIQSKEVHSKLIIIDNQLVSISSANLTQSALLNPYENIYYTKFTKEIDKLITNYLLPLYSTPN